MWWRGETAEGRAPAAGRARAIPHPYAGPELTCVESDAGPLWLRSDDGVMLPYLASNGTWEPDEGTVLRKLVTPGSVFVDVGANVGYFSRLLAVTARPSRVVAFEPHPELAPVLALNTWGLTPTVEVFPLALGSSDGTVVVQSAAHNPGDTRVDASLSRATMLAAMGRMDDVLTGRVDVVKLDVQGFESDVVHGMQRVIRDNPQIAIVAEFWPGALRDRGISPMVVLRQYEALGLTVSLLRGTTPVAVPLDEIVRFCNDAGVDGQANLLLAGPQSTARP